MAYKRGENANIIVGAAALFVTTDANSIKATTIPAFVGGQSYKETLTEGADKAKVRNVGYTNNGLELMFQPDFGEVTVDQLLDTARLFKQGMKVMLKTTLAEATLENLLLAIAGKSADFSTTVPADATWITNLTTGTGATTTAPTQAKTNKSLDITSGELGDYPVERGIIAIGPGVIAGTDLAFDQAERVYIAYRAVSIDSVTVSAKRDAATAFEVNFRLLPDDNGAYGKIVDRSY